MRNSLFRSVEEHGFTQRSIVRYLEERTDAEAAKMLGRAADEPLVYLERLRLSDDESIFLDCSWLPSSLARPLLDVDFGHAALYRELGVRCGVRPDAGWEWLVPAMPTREQRELLGLRARVPALAIERLAFHGAPRSSGATVLSAATGSAMAPAGPPGSPARASSRGNPSALGDLRPRLPLGLAVGR